MLHFDSADRTLYWIFAGSGPVKLDLGGGKPTMRFLCKIGWHKFTRREIHVKEPLTPNQKVFKACIIERCSCGDSRFAIGGETKDTSLHVPSQFNYGRVDIGKY